MHKRAAARRQRPGLNRVRRGLPAKRGSFRHVEIQNWLITIEQCLNEVCAISTINYKSGKRVAKSCNYVIEVPPHDRKALIITKDRVFINWSSCPVRDLTLVTRYFKCQQYGHATKTCQEEASTCGHCGDAGHTIKDCTKKAEPSKCATCLHFKKTSDHQTGNVDCSACRKKAD